MNIWILASIIFAIATIMTMTGRGGGNFYVLALVFSNIPMHEAATTGQFILICSSLTATLFFWKNKIVEWKLVMLIGSITFISSFLGGFFSAHFEGNLLKIIFAIFVLLASVLMLKPFNNKTALNQQYCIKFQSNEKTYYINLYIFIPILLITGFVSGMVGISGGSFLVPLMVLTISVPMHTAVATSTSLVFITASAGFIGHVFTGRFNFTMSAVLAFVAIAGSLIGTQLTLKTNSKTLKIIFAGTSMIAAFIMIYKIFY